jgi:hypothetical protein
MMHFDRSIMLFELFSFSLILFLTVLPIWYFARQRSLEGVVLDQGRLPLIGGTVILTNILTAEVRRCLTDRQGRFGFKGLNTIADYEIVVAHDQHWSEPIALWQNGSHCELHLQLEPIPSEEIKGSSLMVLHDGIADPHWFGVS